MTEFKQETVVSKCVLEKAPPASHAKRYSRFLALPALFGEMLGDTCLDKTHTAAASIRICKCINGDVVVKRDVVFWKMATGRNKDPMRAISPNWDSCGVFVSHVYLRLLRLDNVTRRHLWLGRMAAIVKTVSLFSAVLCRQSKWGSDGSGGGDSNATKGL